MPATSTNTFITMADGVRLAATLFVPEGEGPWPAILEALPYRKDDLTSSYRTEYVRLSEAGYVVCRADVRGTGTSEGVAEDEYPEIERRDMNEVIAWLASQDWCTGNVGMYGTSYSGFNAIQVAMTRPPALKAIIPIFATDDRYADDVHFFGGALKALDLVDYPTYMTGLNALPPVPSLYGQGWRDVWERRVQENEPWVIRWLEEQTFGPYWQRGSLRPDYGAIQAATMIVAGWADGYTNNSLRTMAELTCSKRLILGPWAHASTETSLPGPNVDLLPEMLRWWDRWLKGIDNGVDREPAILVFARRSTKPQPDLAEVRGEWRYEPGWPLDRGRELSMPLENAVAASRPAPDGLEVRGDVGWTAWISCAGNLPYGQPQDQRPDEAWSIVYEWPPLAEELEILGHPRVGVTIRSSAPVAFLSAKLCDVFPDGTSALVTRGLLNLAHRESRQEPSPLEPGTPYRVEVELEVTSWAFEPGHRIRLDLAGSDWPNAWPPPAAATLTVERGGSALMLPVIEGPSPITERPVLAIPSRGQERYESSKGNTVDEVVWRIEHDVLDRETRAVAQSSGTTEAEGERPRFHELYGGTVAVSTRDPAVARADSRASLTIEWPEATVTTEVHQVVRSDATTYHLTIELDVSENGIPRWSRQWDRRIPRRLQ
ncbi:MAG: CocE/NonD family hydrolase [Actinobacteria bacterium]|nr:MAG: CocE/NonD family hydrolase [Actinomycetota bacterium]